MRFMTFLLILGLTTAVYSQEYSVRSKKAIRLYEKANEAFRLRYDDEAEGLLKEAVAVDDNFVEAWYMLAQISLDRQEESQAADYYMRGLGVNPESDPDGHIKVAELLFSSGRYAEAKKYLNQWQSFKNRSARFAALAEKLQRNLDFAIPALKNPVPFIPKSLGDAVNTKTYEYWPSLSVDERTLFFTVLGPQNPDLPPTKLELQEDFYYVSREGDHWTGRTYLGPPVNTNTNEGAQSITADGQEIFFTACNRADGHGRMCDLYSSRKNEDGSWSVPENLGDLVNTTYSEKHPAISADGRFLFFSSNRPGGKGGYDLWMSERKGDAWSKPMNLGDSINTPGMEQSPFIHPDQQTLYFSSDGWPGMGKGDIFLCRLSDDRSWSEPINLGFPINTFNEEVGFIVNARANMAYFSSNRREGTDTDIYSFEMPEDLRPTPVSYLTGRVYDARNMRGIGATFSLTDLETGRAVMEVTSESKEGNYLVSLPTGASYAFTVVHPGYLFYSDHIDIVNSYSRLEPRIKDIPLEPILPGRKIVLNNIFYESDSYNLLETSKIELNRVVDLLKANQGVRVEISGHTDDTGSKEYNLELSLKRAQSVVDYLVVNGIQADRLVAKGYGETQPVAGNETEEGRAQNRRTELKVL